MISVIVPVCNVEPWLRRCIDSILSQTYADWELILVDDGSTDGSRDICEQASISDARVKTFRKDNGGVGSARNAGLRMARGEWIAFVDADDYVEPDFLGCLLDGADGCEHVVMGYTHHYQGEIIKLEMKRAVCSREEMGEGFQYQERCNFNYIWGKLFRHEIIHRHGMCFDETLKICEDYLFMLEYIGRIESVAFVPGCSYHYVRREGSLSRSQRDLADTLRVHEAQTRIFNELIHGRYSFTFEHFIVQYLIEVVEIVIKMLYSHGRKRDIGLLISTDDIARYKQYKKCCSWKEWLLKQTLANGFVTLYARLALLAESKGKKR